MKIYVAGPYKLRDPVINIREAILAGEEIIKLGHIPFIPHLYHLWHTVQSHQPIFWYWLDLKWLPSCDAILRLQGKSREADKEVKEAHKLGIPVFYSLEELKLYNEKNCI